ncbi:MAG: hypothetical protein V2I65_07335 [Paracoccaceae bacterium]|jgi:hypothetical protein|nr:hypothetical protein [Paracoccaceae bacterium]
MIRDDDKIIFGASTQKSTSADDYWLPLKDPKDHPVGDGLGDTRGDDLLDAKLLGYTATDDLWEW